MYLVTNIFSTHQAPSTKHQAPSTKHQAPSTKHQAPSTKHQAPLVCECVLGVRPCFNKTSSVINI